MIFLVEGLFGCSYIIIMMIMVVGTLVYCTFSGYVPVGGGDEI